jgi:ribosome-binding protein aMBF1 (putative translation factor)
MFTLEHKFIAPEVTQMIQCFLLKNNSEYPTKMNRIKQVLEEKGIKQIWLAEKLGKSYNMVNAYVQNRQQPRLEILMKIANILDIDVKELIISNKQENK